ncbi:hypothetical protein [Streptomyces sp. NPDC001508]
MRTARTPATALSGSGDGSSSCPQTTVAGVVISVSAAWPWETGHARTAR